MDTLRDIVLIAATIANGLIAGLLYCWACSVMPGLRRTDDRTFASAFQAMDRAIINPLFVTIFVGAAGLPGVAALLHLGSGHRAVLLWSLAALVLAVATVGITRVVHLPLNAMIQAAGPPDRIADLAAVRERFEARWVRWNIVRTMTSIGAFACLILAMRASYGM